MFCQVIPGLIFSSLMWTYNRIFRIPQKILFLGSGAELLRQRWGMLFMQVRGESDIDHISK